MTFDEFSIILCKFLHEAFFIRDVLAGLLSCKKPDAGDNGNGNTQNIIPLPTDVSTRLHVYLETSYPGGISQPPQFLDVNLNRLYKLEGHFTENVTILSDIYKSRTTGLNNNPGPAVCPDRFFTVTSGARNYVDVNFIDHDLVGSVNNGTGGQWALPGNGKITYSAGSFINPPGGSSLYFTYINPAEKKFVISTPDITADFDQKRWLLKSYGVFYMSLPAFNPAGHNVELEYPIAAELLAQAPDSVQAWHFANDKWTQQGFAKKSGNAYKKKLDKEGVWNFASPVKALYKTIKLRTDQDVPVTNAILRWMSNGREVAAARTDLDGNAFSILPVNEQLSVEILLDWSGTFPPPAFTLTVPPFPDDRELLLTVSAASEHVVTLKGDLNQCGGGAVSTGNIKLLEYSTGKLHAYLPVKEGRFHTAIIVWGNQSFIAKAIDMSSGEEGSDTLLHVTAGQVTNFPITTCQISSALFANFSVDGVSYSITGDSSHYNNPPLGAYYSQGSGPPSTMISCADSPGGTVGFQFDFTDYSVGVFDVNHNWVYVNNIVCETDFLKPHKVTITRYDAKGGFIIGSADFWFRKYNTTETSKHFVGSFKLKRVL